MVIRRAVGPSGRRAVGPSLVGSWQLAVGSWHLAVVIHKGLNTIINYQLSITNYQRLNAF
ncbi:MULTISPECIES: hypothetical protein [unclassified Microcoleus]|uniref:hypothetical protein n=1 Tax=unclassified Microcoleus TaxID=2642155 RepID=UPI002FD24BBA